MASELKHPEWIWYGKDDEGNSRISTGRWAKHACQMRYKLAEIQPTEHDHTRPAPAATDTGLVTVAWQRNIGGSDVENWVSHFILDLDAALGCPVRELVTRSQAVELLAAERAEKEIAERANERCLKETSKLRADNAALTARVKELEGINANLMGDDEDKPRYTTKRLKHEIARATEALEAKLAAAQEALEPFADHAKERAVDAQEWRDTDTVKIVVTIADLRAARAVLGGKPL